MPDNSVLLIGELPRRPGCFFFLSSSTHLKPPAFAAAFFFSFACPRHRRLTGDCGEPTCHDPSHSGLQSRLRYRLHPLDPLSASQPASQPANQLGYVVGIHLSLSVYLVSTIYGASVPLTIKPLANSLIQSAITNHWLIATFRLVSTSVPGLTVTD